jgi:hypothetical protein
MSGIEGERMVASWGPPQKRLDVDSCRVGLIVVATIVTVVVAVSAPEKIHYVNFVGMMTRSDLAVGNSKSLGSLQIKTSLNKVINDTRLNMWKIV